MSYDKICTRCQKGFDQPLDKFFYKKAGTKDGFQQRCKTCVAICNKSHYKNKKDYYKDKAAKNNRRYRQRNQEFILDFLSKNPCVDCGQTNPLLLEFDHQHDKLYDVSQMLTMSEETLKEEIAKCHVRCSFCHRMRTATQFNWYGNVRPEFFNMILNTEITQLEHSIEHYENNIKAAKRIVETGRLSDNSFWVGSVDCFKDTSSYEKQIKCWKNQILLLKGLYR